MFSRRSQDSSDECQPMLALLQRTTMLQMIIVWVW